LSHILLLLGTLLLITSCSSDKPIFKKHRTLYQIGDRPHWAELSHDDSDWKKRLRFALYGNVFWSRTKIDIHQAPKTLKPYGICLHVYGGYGVYWDGVLIGKNGNPGREAEFGPVGQMWTTHRIPIKLTEEGTHVLAIRTSLYYFSDHIGIADLKIDTYDALLTDRLVSTAFMHILAGAFLIASFYFLFLFLGDRKEYRMLIFSICCFLFFILIMTEFIKSYVPIHYTLHRDRLEVIGLLMFGISYLIPLYLSLEFPYPKRKLILIIYAVVLLFIFLIQYDFFVLTARKMALSMWVFSLGIVVFGALKLIRGALLVLLALLLCVVIYFATTFDIGLYAGFGLILLSLLYLLSLRIKEQRLAYETSLVQSSRLKLELVKKNIQPHFLLNTLTSLMDWVEESPKKGVLFIEALAKEFDLFNQIENDTLITITREITLCRTHLQIMEYRKEINYQWHEEGIDPEQKIPPAILHTLLENGITHSLPLPDNTVRFELIYQANEQYRSYTFLTYAYGVQDRSNTKEGTGLKYIKARLTESYQSDWELISEPAEHGWKSVIKLYT